MTTLDLNRPSSGGPGSWRPTTSWVVRPLYLLAMAVVLSVLVFGSSFYEQGRDREAILAVMRHQGRSLGEAVAKAVVNAIHSDEEIVTERLKRLAGISEHVARMWSERAQSDAELAGMAEELRVHEIAVYDHGGNRLGAVWREGPRRLKQGQFRQTG
jgi:hypothetical protein